MKTHKWLRLTSTASAILAAALFGATAAQAGVIDPQIYVCTGCTAPPGGDPNFITPGSINVGFAGNHAAVSPLLIIVGVPGTGAAPTISLPVGVIPIAAGNYYGANTSGGLTGDLDGALKSTGCADAYTCVGLTAGSGGGASESFVNWTTTPFPGGKTNPDAGVTSFSLYVYGIDYALNSGTGGNSPITIDFSGPTTNDFVIAYNCAVSGSSCSDGAIGATPFTDAGFATTTAPEPSAVTLLGMVLVAFFALYTCRLRRALA